MIKIISIVCWATLTATIAYTGKILHDTADALFPRETINDIIRENENNLK